MKTIEKPAELRVELAAVRQSGARIGFVPTMGFLHEGHLSLVRRSRAECDATVASIFVNSAQFSLDEDFERYPRDVARDTALLEAEGTDILFTPSASDVYRAGHSTWIDVEGLSEGMCGAFRPGHFRGVATIVAKLFNMVQPHAVYLGQKDAQQAVILTKMARDLDFDLKVIVCPTVREADGLALSSRNVYLNPDERRRAPALHEVLSEAMTRAIDGERSARVLTDRVADRLERAGFRPQYIVAVGAADLRLLDILAGDVMLAVAAVLGKTRLIDNVVFSVPTRSTSDLPEVPTRPGPIESA